jgi:LacI family transcriptional regulator
MKANNKFTIEDIAREAQTSVTTVSRAINEKTRHLVAASTLRKIDRAVKKHAYFPNIAARNLRSGATNTIGIIFPIFTGLFTSTYYSNILSGVSDYLLETTFRFKIMPMRENQIKGLRYDFRAAEGIDGMIAAHWQHFFSPEEVQELNLPCVFLNDYQKDLPVYSCAGDQFTGGQAAARFLFERGHRQIGIIAGEEASADSRLRIKGFESYLKQQGVAIAPEAIACGNYHENETYALTPEFLRKNPKLTAVFCCNDEMAMGFIRKAQELGVNCPRDISVVGYDNISQAASFSPALTTIEEPLYQIARAGAMALTTYLKEGNTEKPLLGEQFFTSQLIARDSARVIS